MASINIPKTSVSIPKPSINLPQLQNMGITASKGRWLAPASFALNVAAQLYGMLSSPNMKDIHDDNMSFFSPQPWFIAAFFFPQQIIQAAWLYKLWKVDGRAGGKDKKDSDLMADYVPAYIVGNLSIAAWMLAWNSSALKLSHVFVTINTFTQLYYTAVRLPDMDVLSGPSILTHLVVKTFAGIGVLDFLHNGSVAFFRDQFPTYPVQIVTGLGFFAGGLGSDWIFGICLVYDLVALSVGQARDPPWRSLLGVYAGLTAVAVTAKNYLSPPYTKRGYDPAPMFDEVEERE